MNKYLRHKQVCILLTTKLELIAAGSTEIWHKIAIVPG